MVTHQLEPADNGKIKCIVRCNGFVVDWAFFDDDKEAKCWGENHDGAIGKSALLVANKILNPET